MRSPWSLRASTCVRTTALHDVQTSAVPFERLDVQRLGKHVAIVRVRVYPADLPIVLVEIIVDELESFW